MFHKTFIASALSVLGIIFKFIVRSMSHCHNFTSTSDISQVQYQLSTVTCHTCPACPRWKIFSITYCGFLPSVFLVTSFTRSVWVFAVWWVAWPAWEMVRDWGPMQIFQLWTGNILDLYQDRTDVEWAWWKHLFLNYCEFLLQMKEFNLS